MALSTATLTVKITETLTLNGVDQGGTVTKTISSLNQCTKRIVNVPTSSEITVYTTGADNASGQHDLSEVKYTRLTNLDGSNYCLIRVTETNNDEFVYKLEAGCSFLLGTHSVSMSAAAAGSAGASGAFGSISSVELQADTAAVPVELFIAAATD